MNEMNKKEMLMLFSYIAAEQIPLLKQPEEPPYNNFYLKWIDSYRSMKSFAEAMDYACSGVIDLDELAELKESSECYIGVMYDRSVPDSQKTQWFEHIRARLLYTFALLHLDFINKHDTLPDKFFDEYSSPAGKFREIILEYKDDLFPGLVKGANR